MQRREDRHQKKRFDTAPGSLQQDKIKNNTARGQRHPSAPCVTERYARLESDAQNGLEALRRAKECARNVPKMLLGKTFRSVRQVHRFHWDESRTAPSRQPHLPALWAPAKLTSCNPGGTRPHSPRPTRALP